MAIAPAREGRGGFASRPRQNRLPWKSIREAAWKTNEAQTVNIELHPKSWTQNFWGAVQ